MNEQQQQTIFKTEEEPVEVTEPEQPKERKPMVEEVVRADMVKIKDFMLKNEMTKENVQTAYNMFKPIAEYFFTKFLNEFNFNKVENNIWFGMDNNWQELAVEIDFCGDRMNYQRLTKILVKFNNMKDIVNDHDAHQEIVKGDVRSASGDMI